MSGIENERNRAKDALAASERDLRLIIDSIPGMVAVFSAVGELQFVNNQVLRYFGATQEELKNWQGGGYTHPEDNARSVEAFAQSIASGEWVDNEVRARRFDGVYRWFQSRGHPLRDANGHIARWCNLLTDIDDRKRVEEDLRRSEGFLLAGQRLSLTGTFLWRSAAEEFTWSEELYRIYEFPRDVRITFELIASRYHPEDKHCAADVARQARNGVRTFDYGHRLLMPDGSIKHLHIVAHGRQDKDGDGLEYFGAVQDVTQRRLAEEARDTVRSELAHVTRVMSLGALTASIAHEVNQPLAGIKTNANVCLRMLDIDPPKVDGAREATRRMIRDANRAVDVIARLRALFSRTAPVTETVDLNEATRGVLALLSNELFRNQVALQVELDDDPLLVIGDRVQLQEVIHNLVRNASDAMSGVSDRPHHLFVKASRVEEGGARLMVRDVGVGFAPQVAERLFDAFYTTKPDGMGIGLLLSRSIIESHGGKLWAEPNDGPGATFAFLLPPRA
jgi:PAS domain S-box-containing protein